LIQENQGHGLDLTAFCVLIINHVLNAHEIFEEDEKD
jgi:hypothetical protein